MISVDPVVIAGTASFIAIIIAWWSQYIIGVRRDERRGAQLDQLTKAVERVDSKIENVRQDVGRISERVAFIEGVDKRGSDNR